LGGSREHSGSRKSPDPRREREELELCAPPSQHPSCSSSVRPRSTLLPPCVLSLLPCHGCSSLLPCSPLCSLALPRSSLTPKLPHSCSQTLLLALPLLPPLHSSVAPPHCSRGEREREEGGGREEGREGGGREEGREGGCREEGREGEREETTA
jgi:hypothetical protein